jgi:hypothetical protein
MKNLKEHLIKLKIMLDSTNNTFVKKIDYIIKFYKLSKYVIILFLTKLPPNVPPYLSFPHHLNGRKTSQPKIHYHYHCNKP